MRRAYVVAGHTYTARWAVVLHQYIIWEIFDRNTILHGSGPVLISPCDASRFHIRSTCPSSLCQCSVPSQQFSDAHYACCPFSLWPQLLQVCLSTSIRFVVASVRHLALSCGPEATADGRCSAWHLITTVDVPQTAGKAFCGAFHCHAYC